MKKYFSFVLLIFLCFSCKKQDPVEYHHEYFGMEEGRYVIYDVQKITHASLTVHDTSNYQLKTTWGEIYIDNEGREGRTYRRYKRLYPTSDWELLDVWYGGIYGIRAELVEENVRIVNLIFAPTSGKEWDINAYNQESEVEAFYRDIHEPYSVNGTDFDSTLMVDMGDEAVEDNGLKLIRKYNIYAKGVGLIEKVDRDIDYYFGNLTPAGGTELFYTFVETGLE